MSKFGEINALENEKKAFIEFLLYSKHEDGLQEYAHSKETNRITERENETQTNTFNKI